MILLTAGSILRIILEVSTRNNKMMKYYLTKISKRAKRTTLTTTFVKMKINNRLRVMNNTMPALDLC